MRLKIGILMDAIEHIKPYKDTSFAMMLAAQARGHDIYYFQHQDIWFEEGEVWGRVSRLTLRDSISDYYRVEEVLTLRLDNLDVILMRKDPPFDLEYIYATYLLEQLELKGVVVANPPNALRTVNEKFAIANFPNLTPKTLITRDIQKINEFVQQYKKAVVKPLDGMGGSGIFQLSVQDKNCNAILETLGNGQYTLMVQAYLENVTAGDKRILLIDGEPSQHGLARIPQGNEFRANLAAGGVVLYSL